jgi:hypothetical protein
VADLSSFTTSNDCSIETLSAVEIRQYSAFAAEDEVLLLPGTVLEVFFYVDRATHVTVVASIAHADDMTEIQLREVAIPFQLIA